MNKKDNINDIESMRKCKECGTNLRMVGADGQRYEYWCPKCADGGVKDKR